MNKLLTVIMHKDTNDYEKVIREDKFQDDRIQLIVVDSIEEYNGAIEKVQGKYIYFTKTSTIIGSSTYKKILKDLKEECVYNLCPVYINDKGQKYNDNFYKEDIKTITLDDEITTQNVTLDSYIFLFSKIKSLRFDEKLNIEAKQAYLIDALNKYEKIHILPYNCICTAPMERNFDSYEPQHYKWWYNSSLKNFVEPYLNKYKNFLSQSLLMYILTIKFLSNMNARNKNVLNESELDEFLELTKKCVGKTDDKVFVSHAKIKNYQKIVNIFLDMKYGNNHSNIVRNFEDDINIEVVTMNYDERNLIIDCKLDDIELLKLGAKLSCYINNKKVDIIENEIYSFTQFFGMNMYKACTFQVIIEFEKIVKNSKINFYIEMKTHKNLLNLVFHSPYAKLNTEYPCGYWNFNQNTIVYQTKSKSLIISKRKWYKTLLREIKLFYNLLRIKYKKSLNKFFQYTALRTIYWITRPYYKNKNIWITFDKLYKGGDNGEYFFRYVMQQENTNVNIYYVLDSKAINIKQMILKYKKNILVFNSLRHKLLVLHSNMIFATHSGVSKYCGFSNSLIKYFTNLFNADICCIQHGLSIHDIAGFQNRVKTNTKLYFLASKYEYFNLIKPEYGYNESQLKMVGLARYDGLLDKDKKQVLITPTWRKDVVKHDYKIGDTQEYSPFFKESEYFKVYNELINDKKLIECANENGYKIVYLLHPALTSQIDDFTKNNYVDIQIGGNINYEKILTESSVMITDYSGVQFDFAYMRKPVIYYHPDTLPPHYDKGEMDYVNNGFGPICENKNYLIEEVCNFMNNSDEYKSKYKERFDNFFEFNDYNNCNRIYELAIEYQKNNKKGVE